MTHSVYVKKYFADYVEFILAFVQIITKRLMNNIKLS